MSHDLRRAALLALLATASFALAAAFIRAASASVNSTEIVFFRSLVSLLAMLPWAFKVGAAGIRTSRPGGHLWRCVLGLAAMYCYFYSLGQLRLADAVLFNYSTPLYIPFIAWLWMGERPPGATIPAALLGLMGIMLIVKPGSGALGWPALIGIISGVFAAGAMVGIRRISDTEPAARIVFWFTVWATLVSGVPMLWAWRTPTLPELGLLIAVGLASTLGQLSLTRAYALAPAARIGPFTYTSVLFSALLGWLIWAEAPDGWSLLGMGIVVASCLLAGYRRREPQLED